ncbi:MAG: glycosyltransferase family 2 protein [Bacteroidaceae bacterium]|nr:glycosyltransferase family 2 protein [Bacteroidaceae bacterium]
MKLSVIIVNYNVKYHLEQCIRSVQKASEGLSADIWVVDNASSDGSMDYLQPLFPDIHFISNTENVGYSRANNQAIRESKGEYVLLLNPDTIVAEDTLKGCVDFLDAHPKVGATGVRMLNADGTFAPESRRGLPTPFTSFCKMTGLSALFPKSRTFGKYYMKYLDADEANPIEVISGAFNMLRRKALDEVGLLDEKFFMYGEDIDLSYRMLLGGWQNYYIPYSILHYKGESTQKSSFRYVHVFYNAMLIFFNKHFGKKYFLIGYLIQLAVVFRALLDMLIRLLDRILPERKPADIPYMRFDLRKTSVTEMLSALRNQEATKKKMRSMVETISFDGTMLIRHNEVIPFKD